MISFIVGLYEHSLASIDYRLLLYEGRICIYLDNSKAHKTKELDEFYRRYNLNVIFPPLYWPKKSESGGAYILYSFDQIGFLPNSISGSGNNPN
jgi:hypothetical protein